MSTKDKGLFIAISPSHILSFESIIKGKLFSGKTILLNPGNFEYKQNMWDVVINGDMDLTYTVSSRIDKFLFQLKKLKDYKNYHKKIESQISLKQPFYFFYCNLDDVLTNHIFQNLKSYEENSFYVVEDGILNYYNPVRALKTLHFKKKFSNFYGLKFEVFFGHPTNIQSKMVKGQYVRLPKKAIYSEKSLSLPFEQIRYLHNPKTVLIIGQDIMHNSVEGEVYYKERLSILFDKIKEEGIEDQSIVYKPHRNGDISIALGLLKLNFRKFEVYRDNTPIEECITRIKPIKIYSFESSAMLNLKIALDMDNIHFAILPFSKNANPLLNLYEELGINILK